jgi:dipeptidyl-peptidase-4
MRRIALGLLLSCILPGIAAVAASAERCDDTLAATRDYRNGMPTHVTPLSDGKSVLYLASGPRDTVQKLYRFDLGGTAHELASSETLGGGALGVEEKARRERARISVSGLTDYALAPDGRTALIDNGGRLSLVETRSGVTHALPGSGWIAPVLSPDGAKVAAVRDDTLHVIDIATGADQAVTPRGDPDLTHGVAEFAASEEFDRLDGAWWAPDGRRLVVETADSRMVEQHFIANPGDPSVPPVGFRYPRAGTPNAIVTLQIVPVAGGRTVQIEWDHDAYPYLARVVWPRHGALSLVVLDRSQTHERVMAVDPSSGAARTLLEEHDPAWINVTPFAFARNETALPAWLPDGSGFLWASERSGQWRLEARHADGTLDHPITPANFRYSALLDVEKNSVVVSGGPDRLSETIYRVPVAGGVPTVMAGERGMHAASFGSQHEIFSDSEGLADGTTNTVVRSREGKVLATVPSLAETPESPVNVAFTTAGPDGFDAAIVRPRGWRSGTKLPVVLSVYAGPGFKMVRADTRDYEASQCLADHGAFVVSIDGRGTPGRGRDFERATRLDLIDKPLADQIVGLQALGRMEPAMDLSRTAVMGWSFGGYFSAMATIRRPDVFRAGIAGAPPVDWQDYDTAYTERYLGLPAEHPNAYRVSNVLTYAAGLARPLLVVHGLTDDNVYFVNTFKLTQALLKAGKPYDLVLLPGTHMLADPAFEAAEQDRVVEFLSRTIGITRQQ